MSEHNKSPILEVLARLRQFGSDDREPKSPQFEPGSPGAERDRALRAAYRYSARLLEEAIKQTVEQLDLMLDVARFERKDTASQSYENAYFHGCVAAYKAALVLLKPEEEN